MRRMTISGVITPEEMARAEKLAPLVRLKPSELVPIGFSRVLDEIERTGSVLVGPAIDWQARIEEPERPRGRKRPHPLFGN
jgi:hypothetical protein